MSTGAFNTPAAISTQQFGGGRVDNIEGRIPAELGGTTTDFTFQDILNVFAFRPGLNIGVLIKALKSKGLIEILAEPNIIATSGKEASFLVGGEFPVPVVQGGATAGAITIQFREFGNTDGDITGCADVGNACVGLTRGNITVHLALARGLEAGGAGPDSVIENLPTILMALLESSLS